MKGSTNYDREARALVYEREPQTVLVAAHSNPWVSMRSSATRRLFRPCATWSQSVRCPMLCCSLDPLMFAKALNCEPMQDDFCGECARCRRAEEMLDAARHDLATRRVLKDAARRTEGFIYFDVQLIEPLTRYILIEQIRQLRTVAYTHPFEFARRVLIIDQAQAVHWQAVDLLLKLLEEAPESTTVVLVCPNRYELRATLRSRCRLISFGSVEESMILGVLVDHSKVPESRRALVARLAAGSVARALVFNLEAFQRQR